MRVPAEVVALVAALAAGFVVGVERGWRDREVRAGGRVAGLRTFALVGLLGGVFSLVDAWLVPAGAIGLALLGIVSYRESVRTSGNLSATSTVALLLTFGLGALAGNGSPLVALGAAVMVAVLLDLRPALHRWLRLMEHRELRAALQMLVLSAVVLPLLPDEAYGPYGALNPYRLWWAVVLVAGLSLSGYVAMRLFGAQRGALWTGLLGGLASSTAATLTLARQAHAHPGLQAAALAGALAACAVMYLRILVVLAALAPALAGLLLVPFLVTAAALLLVATLQWRRRGIEGDAVNPTGTRVFDLGTALAFGALLGLMAVLAEASRRWLGDEGLYGLSLLTGVADVDAITISLARMESSGNVVRSVAAVAIVLAALANMMAKAVIAWVAGGRAMGMRLAAGYAIAMTSGAIAAALLLGHAPA